MEEEQEMDEDEEAEGESYGEDEDMEAETAEDEDMYEKPMRTRVWTILNQTLMKNQTTNPAIKENAHKIPTGLKTCGDFCV